MKVIQSSVLYKHIDWIQPAYGVKIEPHTNLHFVTELFDGFNVATNKKVLRFQLFSTLPSSRYDVTGHEGLTTTTTTTTF